jgi:uncharacterized protein
VLRVNVYSRPAEGRFPVLLSAHPYGKDKLPVKSGAHLLVPVIPT